MDREKCLRFCREKKDFLRAGGTLYFIGIGGSGMYGLARLAYDLGYRVLGSDKSESENVKRLLACGISVTVGTESLPEELDAVVYSLAVDEEHPQRKEASEREMPTLSRAELLGILMEGYPVRIAISGSHGKSSTVGMCASILTAYGLSPSVLIGADLSKEDGGYQRGAGNILLTEACEYKDSFLSFSPTHAVVLNAEWDHTDYFPSRRSVLLSFSRFLEKESISLRLVDDKTGLKAENRLGCATGFHIENLTLKKGCPCFSVMKGREALAELSLRVVGAHQAQNALAAFSLSYLMGVPVPVISDALSRYGGVGGRMEYRMDCHASPVYLDYAHHPTELRCAIESAREIGKRVVCVFEPHTYSRVSAFFLELSAALRLADAVGVLPIYAAREKNVYGVSAKKLAKASGGTYLPSFEAGADFLKKNAREDTVLLLAGAGLIAQTLRFMA